jgi:hypothetical protein
MTFLAETNPVYTQTFWGRPVPRDFGDPDAEEIYRNVGYSLSQWEFADQALADLFLAFAFSGNVGTAQAYNVARRAYGSIAGNAGRRNAVLAAAEAFFLDAWQKKPVRQSIINIVNAVQWASNRRDDIAHGIVWGKIRTDGKDFGAFHMPPEYNTGRTHAFPQSGTFAFSTAKYRYVAADIATFGDKFGELRRTIRGYADMIFENGDEVAALVRRLTGDDQSATTT